ncbi:VWA domain-containing protein, partial [Escherichia coli]|nr:VWA domain-containing protein [Escherichia coli]EJO9114709.1 VWA domain-containing protein [Escherichia coli]
MGTSRWDDSAWVSHTSSVKTKTREEIFSSSHMLEKFDPKKITVRESRDSALNPNSNAIIVALDVTGSMGINAEQLARNGLGVMVEEIIKRKPVSDPHVMCMGIGDVKYDSAPLQVTQFEADITIAEDLKNIYLEGGGGGNCFESYNLAWYFAALNTSIDCYEKRGKKGYLFTLGDEEAPEDLLASEIRKVFGNQETKDYTSEQLLNMASKMYHVYHIVVKQGSHARHYFDDVMKSWKELLGQRVLVLEKNEDLAEVIVSTIEVNEGRAIKDVIDSWSPDKALSVKTAITQLAPYEGGSSGTGVV